jgi:cell division protein FtsB
MPGEEDKINDPLLDLKRKKLEAEIAKIESETNDVKKSFFRKPNFWSMLFSLMVPIISFFAYYFWGGGKQLFDLKSEQLKWEQTKLSRKNDSLEHRAKAMENRPRDTI